ncbi:hypothetical protein [Nocardia concava]|uniref:hypothetical protein n=1 Tax=Nocardia concava TaxID=257281 RepID=UPI000594C3F1|nr:hypothetical protein [Nocardia concava]
MPIDTAALPRFQPAIPVRSPRTARPRAAAAPRLPIPAADTLAAAALGRRTALAEVLAYSHAFATAYCRAALGSAPSTDHLPAQISTAIATGWPTARAARRDFLEFAHTTARHAVRICGYQHPRAQALAPLTDQQREILTLRVLLGFSPLETSVALGIPILEVHRETTRTLTRLRHRMAVPAAVETPARGPVRLDQRTRGSNSTKGIRRVVRRW